MFWAGPLCTLFDEYFDIKCNSCRGKEDRSELCTLFDEYFWHKCYFLSEGYFPSCLQLIYSMKCLGFTPLWPRALTIILQWMVWMVQNVLSVWMWCLRIPEKSCTLRICVRDSGTTWRFINEASHCAFCIPHAVWLSRVSGSGMLCVSDS